MLVKDNNYLNKIDILLVKDNNYLTNTKNVFG